MASSTANGDDYDDSGTGEQLDSEASIKPGQLEGVTLHQLIGRNWVTLNQLTKLLGVTYQTTLRYVKQDKVKAVRVGGQYRIYEEELRRFLQEGNR